MTSTLGSSQGMPSYANERQVDAKRVPGPEKSCLRLGRKRWPAADPGDHDAAPLAEELAKMFGV